MRADYIQRIDLDIVETIVSRELERYKDIKARASELSHPNDQIHATGAIEALNMVADRLGKHKKVRK
jgi:hypothetical protein